MAIEVGSIVRLKDNPSAGIATVVCFLESVKGGVRLSRRLGDFMFWNVAELNMTTQQTTSFRDIYLIMVDGPTGWRRVGPVYRSKELAKSWVPFVKASWHMRTRTKRVRIPLLNGRPTPKAVKRFDVEFQIDLI